MKLDRLLKFMDFMMSVAENMEIRMCGDILQILLIIYHLLLLLIILSFVYMEDYHLLLINWIIFEILIELWRSQLMDQCAIYYGLILLTKQDGLKVLEEQDLILEKI